jgi:hypothetical protein
MNKLKYKKDNIKYEIVFEEYNEITMNIMKEFSREYRSKNGQFFTPYYLTNLCIEKIQKYMKLEDKLILEPSCGSLQFYDTIKNITNKQIHLYESDNKIVKMIKDKINTSTILFNEDFLVNTKNNKYDLIIGNPPYYELSQSKQKYESKLIKGRYNIYALFVEKCIDSLNNNGLLCFIIPQNMMTSPSYSEIRKYVKNKCNILDITNLKNFSEDVSQDVNIYIFQKTNILNTDYTMGELFSYDKININYTNMKKIKDICKVVGGNIVWNQHKDSLNNEKKGYRLIYSDDIECINENIIKKNKEKKLYIETKKPSLILPVLIVARGSKIKYELIENSNVKLIAENHVNVISGKIEDLKKICDNFKDKRLESYIKNILTTLNLSKTQLENIPIFT